MAAAPASAGLTRTVTEADTALAVGSGTLPVLGTPRLIAWCEAATCAVPLDPPDAARTSVGTRVELDHLAASPVGSAITVTATLTGRSGSRLTFAVTATDAGGREVARGVVHRALVDPARFLSRLT